MSNFLTRWTKQVSVVSETPAATQREEFQNTVASFRKATGKPETRTIPCRCAVTGRAFVIIFERFSPGQSFEIVRIELDDAGDHRGNIGGRLGRKRQLTSYDGEEFDWTGLACPHCRRRPGIVYCGNCRETVCAGRVLSCPDETRSFRCHDACGAVGKLQPCDRVQGAAASSTGNGPAPGLLPRSAAAARLPRRPALRLPRSLRK